MKDNKVNDWDLEKNYTINNQNEICKHPLLYCFNHYTRTYWVKNKKYENLESKLYYIGFPTDKIEEELMINDIKRHIMIYEDVMDCACLYCGKRLTTIESNKRIKPSRIINYNNYSNSSEDEYLSLHSYLKLKELEDYLPIRKMNKILQDRYNEMNKENQKIKKLKK